MPDLPLVDQQCIANLRDLNPGDNDEFLREIIGIYLEDTPARIAELEESLASGDTARFTRAAHSIKGSSSNLGAMAVRGIAETLEHQSSRQGLGDVVGLITTLKEKFAETRVELSKFFPVA